jgi:hypothetical protein
MRGRNVRALHARRWIDVQAAVEGIGSELLLDIE